MQTVTTIAALREVRARWRDEGKRVALVPTMGNLHAGHLALVVTAGEHADRVVSSIFVNPLQFAAGEDFDDYPRTFASDQAALQSAGCALLFAPDDAEIYPRGRDITQVSVPELGATLCGEDRPGHFDGVATVVSILFNIVRPECAVFGQKDYQQLQVIRQMVRDLHVPVKIIAQPTHREVDGLAMSSRNQYLGAEERSVAPVLHQCLQDIAYQLRKGSRDFAGLQQRGMERLRSAGFQPLYLQIRRADFGPPDAATSLVILVAARLGKTRLIDNVAVEL